MGRNKYGWDSSMSQIEGWMVMVIYGRHGTVWKSVGCEISHVGGVY